MLSLVFVLLWFTWQPPESSLLSDDGVYAISAKAASAGDWSVPHVVVGADPLARTHPYEVSVTEEGYFLGSGHFSWTGLLSVAYSAGGVFGLRALPAIGIALTVLATARLARAAERADVAVLAGVLVAISPVLYQGMQLWAHTVATAAFAFAVGSALAVIEDATLVRVGHVLGAALGCAAAAALRGEAVIFALSLAAVTGVSLGGKRRAYGLVVAASIAAGTMVGHLGAGEFTGHITGTANLRESAGLRIEEGGSILGLAGEKLSGLLNTVFITTAEGDDRAAYLLAGALLMAVLGIVLGRTGRWALGTWAIVAATLLWVVKLLVYPEDPATGLLGAWPVALVAVLRPWRRMNPAEKRLFIVVVLSIAGVVVGQGQLGAAFNWGGRYILPAAPALAVLGATALKGMSLHSERARSVLVISALIGVAFVSMLVFDASNRARYERRSAELATVPQDVPFVTSLRHVPPRDWATYPERSWLRVPNEPGGAEFLRSVLLRSGFTEVVAYGMDPEHLEVLAGDDSLNLQLIGGIAYGPYVLTVEPGSG